MKKKKNKRILLVLVLLLGISIGYAALASNLKINGTSGVKANTWSVYWNNVQITNGSVPADNNNKARITDSAKTQVEFNVVLSEPGDFYEYTVDAVNNGTIDAMIASQGIVNGVYSDSNYTQTATLPEAVSYTVTYADGSPIQEKHLLSKKNGSTPTKETYKVRIEYRNDESINPSDLDDTDKTFYFKFSVNYVQADNSAVAVRSAIRRVKTQNEGQITPGDIIGIGETEDFYVISSNSEETVLLAKYNLLVGNESHDGGSSVTPMNSSTTAGYGLQSEDAIGYNWDTQEWKGMVAFSSTNYWNDGNGTLLSPYNSNGASYDGNPYPYVYDNTYTTAPDFSSECDESTNCYYTPGYSIAYYVEQYKTKLIEMGAPSTITSRLLTFEEATSPSIGCDANKHSCPQDSFISNTTFWLGSALGGDGVWDVYSGGDFGYSYYDGSEVVGVRPVIEISTSEIK